MKGIQVVKEGVKLSLFTDTVSCSKSEAIYETIELNEFSKVVGYKSNYISV